MDGLKRLAGEIAAQVVADKNAGTPMTLAELADIRIQQRTSEIRFAAVDDVRALVAEACAPKPKKAEAKAAK